MWLVLPVRWCCWLGATAAIDVMHVCMYIIYYYFSRLLSTQFPNHVDDIGEKERATQFTGP